MRLIFLSFSLLLSATSLGALQAQSLKLKKANNLFDCEFYDDAIFLYKKLLNKRDSVEAKVQLGATYFKLNQPKEAAYWYNQVFNALTDRQTLEYGESLKKIGKIEKAKEVFQQIPPTEEIDIKKYIESCTSYDFISTDPNIYTTKILNVNTPKADFAPAFYKDGVVFVTETPVNNLPNSVSIFSLLKTKIADNLLISFEEATPFFQKTKQYIRSKHYLQPTTLTFSSTFDTLYFTGVTNTQQKNLKIYQQHLLKDKDTWSIPTLLTFNEDEEETFAHPSFTADGKTMYVVSDMAGGFGETDIYVTYQIDTGWTELKNLGPKINTRGKETFPFISSDDVLYFASDTHPGLGGLDIFRAKRRLGGRWERPENLRPPINSPYDDFSFIIDKKQKSGYFASNREGGLGNDDLYYFTTAINKPICQLKGKIMAENGQKMKNVTVTIKNEKTGKVKKMITKRDGAYQFQLLTDASYTLTTTQSFCLTQTQQLDLANEQVKEVNIILHPLDIKDLRTGLLNKPIRLGEANDNLPIPMIPPIYYDLVNHTVCAGQDKAIDDIVYFLKLNPNIILEIGVHTTSRGAAISNKDISRQRAKNLKQQLINKGISPKRLVANGHGEEKITNQCTDNVPCSDIEHAENNRTEFLIIKYLLRNL